MSEATLQYALHLIAEERERQDEKWGKIELLASRDPRDWYSILGEESGVAGDHPLVIDGPTEVV